MKNCYFCGDEYTEQYVLMGGAISTLIILACMVVVQALRTKLLKAHHREPTSMQYLDRQNSQLIQQHPNFYPIQPQQNNMHQYLIQQQDQMNQSYLMHNYYPARW